MAILTVRNLKPAVHQRLREQAAANGRSMEAEARAILEAGVGDSPPDLISGLRRFAEETRMTEDELATVFPARTSEQQRTITFSDEGS